jgi:solute carrier family 36 (proton-coupled amino acid transporter)
VNSFVNKNKYGEIPRDDSDLDDED